MIKVIVIIKDYGHSAPVSTNFNHPAYDIPILYKKICMGIFGMFAMRLAQVGRLAEDGIKFNNELPPIFQGYFA